MYQGVYDFLITCYIFLESLIILMQWLKNRRSPLIMTQAKVLDKHVQIQNIRRKRSSGPGYVKHKMYIYYVLFEIEGGDTLEFQVKKGEYMKIKKGQFGELTFQGKRYIKFDTKEVSL